MLEMVLEENYPKTMTTKDGKSITVRPVTQEDEQALITFFSEFPAEEVAYLIHDVRNPKVIRQWLKSLDYERALPLVAIYEGKIIGDAVLNQDARGWQTHVGHVATFTHPNYRGIGLARLLVGEIIEIGMHCGLVKLDAEFMGEQGKPMSAFQEMGFVPTATLPGHVQDIKGNFHDLVILVYDLRSEERYAAD